MSVSTPNEIRLPRSATRRPSRSPTTPPMKPPNIMPTNPAVSAGVSAERGTCHSRMIAGSAPDSTWLSRPSNTMASAAAATSAFWYPPQSPSSSTALRSTVFIALIRERR